MKIKLVGKKIFEWYELRNHKIQFAMQDISNYFNMNIYISTRLQDHQTTGFNSKLHISISP